MGARSTDLLATTGDILRLWELVDNPHYGKTSNSINGRNTPAYFTQQLIKKAELVNVKVKKKRAVHQLDPI